MQNASGSARSGGAGLVERRTLASLALATAGGEDERLTMAGLDCRASGVRNRAVHLLGQMTTAEKAVQLDCRASQAPAPDKSAL